MGKRYLRALPTGVLPGVLIGVRLSCDSLAKWLRNIIGTYEEYDENDRFTLQFF